MTFQSWLRGLTVGASPGRMANPSYNRSRATASRSHRPGRRLIVERLEDRTLLTADLDFGLAFGFGGASNDVANEVASDTQGNIYVAGTFVNSMDADPGPGEVLLSNGIGPENFVAKYSAAGSLLWARHLGGSSTNYAGTYADLALDAQGNVFVTGSLRATSSFGSTTLTRDGVSDAFLTKLDPDGNFQWATRIGTSLGTGPSSTVTGSGVAIDSSGNVYSTGFGGGTFVARHDPAGNLAWEQTVAAQGLDIAADGAGVYVTGGYSGTVDFNPSPGTYNLNSTYAPNFGNTMDPFVLKLDAAGNFVWAGGLESQGWYDYGNGIAVDGSGNVHIAGNFGASNDFDPGAGTLTLNNAGNSDAFVIKLDADRNLLWARSMGGTSNDTAIGIALDSAGNVYTTGQFGYFAGSSAGASADFEPGSGTYILTSAGYSDAFVGKLTSAGDFAWAGRLGGTGADRGNGIAVDGSGNVFATGSFGSNGSSADFDPGAGAYNLTSAGLYDVFVSKLIENQSPPPPLPGTSLTISDVTVAEGNSGTIGATFTVNLHAASTETVLVSYATASGTAIAGSDFVAMSGALSFALARRARRSRCWSTATGSASQTKPSTLASAVRQTRLSPTVKESGPLWTTSRGSASAT